MTASAISEESARLALATASTEGRVTNSRLKELSNRHSRDLTFLLTDLVEKGFLDPHDQRRARWYTVALERSSVQSAGPSSEQSTGGSVQSAGISEGRSEQSARGKAPCKAPSKVGAPGRGAAFWPGSQRGLGHAAKT